MLTPHVGGLLLAFLPTQHWQEGSSEPGFLLRLVVSNLRSIPTEMGPGQVRVCSPASPVLRVRGSPWRVCWVLCLCVWAQLLRQCLQGAVAIRERPAKRCHWPSWTTATGCRMLSRGAGSLGEQSSPQRAVAVLHRHRSLVSPLLRWVTVWGPGRTGSSASGTKVLLRAGLATAAPPARPGVGGLLGNHLCLQPPLPLRAAWWVPLTQHPPALRGHRPEEAAGPLALPQRCSEGCCSSLGRWCLPAWLFPLLACPVLIPLAALPW